MWLVHNPLVYRGVRSTFRRAGFWGGMLGLGLLMGFVLFCLYLDTARTGGRHTASGIPMSLWQTTAYRYAWFCLGLEMFVAVFVTLWVMGDSVVQERRQNTFDFLQTLPLSPGRKALGLLLGRCTWVLAVAAVAGIAGTISARIGGVAAERIAWLHGIAVSGFAASGCLGMAMSLGLGRLSLGGLAAVVLLLLSMGISGNLLDTNEAVLPLLPLAAGASLSWSLLSAKDLPGIIQQGRCHFYSLSVPWQASPVVFYLFLAGVFFLAARRNFARAGAAAPRWRGLLGLVLFHYLLIGFLYDDLERARQWVRSPDAWWGPEIRSLFLARVCTGYLAGFGPVLLLWMILRTPAMDAVITWMRHRPRGWRGTTLVRSFFDGRSPTWPAGLAGWAVSLGAALAINHFFFEGAVSVRGLLAVASVWALFLLGYAAWFQAGMLFNRSAGTLVGALFLSACLLGPSLLAAATDEESPLYATPVGVMIHADGMFTPLSKDEAKEAWEKCRQNVLGGLVVLALGQGVCIWQRRIVARRNHAGSSEQTTGKTAVV